MTAPLLVHRETFRDRPGPASLRGAGFDAGVSHALLRAVAEGSHPECLRLYRPADALAFSSLDRTNERFDAAAARARASGFEPMIRLTGGRAAAFERQGLAFAWTLPIEDMRGGIHPRFEKAARWVATALAGLGVDAQVGCVPREYCPGEYSVNHAGKIKLMGVGQRVIRGAAHIGGVIVVQRSARVREVLAEVYDELGYPLDAATVGAVDDAVPGADAGMVADALLNALVDAYSLREEEIPPRFVADAERLMARHELEKQPVRAAGHPKAVEEQR